MILSGDFYCLAKPHLWRNITAVQFADERLQLLLQRTDYSEWVYNLEWAIELKISVEVSNACPHSALQIRQAFTAAYQLLARCPNLVRLKISILPDAVEQYYAPWDQLQLLAVPYSDTLYKHLRNICVVCPSMQITPNVKFWNLFSSFLGPSVRHLGFVSIGFDQLPTAEICSWASIKTLIIRQASPNAASDQALQVSTRCSTLDWFEYDYAGAVCHLRAFPYWVLAGPLNTLTCLQLRYAELEQSYLYSGLMECIPACEWLSIHTDEPCNFATVVDSIWTASTCTSRLRFISLASEEFDCLLPTSLDHYQKILLPFSDKKRFPALALLILSCRLGSLQDMASAMQLPTAPDRQQAIAVKNRLGTAYNTFHKAASMARPQLKVEFRFLGTYQPTFWTALRLIYHLPSERGGFAQRLFHNR